MIEKKNHQFSITLFRNQHSIGSFNHLLFSPCPNELPYYTPKQKQNQYKARKNKIESYTRELDPLGEDKCSAVNAIMERESHR